MTGLSVFDTTVQKSMKLIHEVQKEAHIEDKHKAFQALRITLQTLRDRLPVQEAAHLGAQLPNLLAGFYYEGWKPAATPVKDRTQDDFLEHIRDYLQNVDVKMDAVHSARGVFKVLSNHISEGEVEDIINALPEELRNLWPEQVINR